MVAETNVDLSGNERGRRLGGGGFLLGGGGRFLGGSFGHRGGFLGGLGGGGLRSGLFHVLISVTG
ncbi:hypothetical protein ESB00_13940 [Oleiharenicola lentus]|uniref:Uncharacterized protein n=1 Tax=Oleiharenicola lentus TaxID=2508720 RepID=A0A4V1M5V3_9BACT|nr:hypothetical protein ESB00_13940 [Oleiharenicola lentus]